MPKRKENPHAESVNRRSKYLIQYLINKGIITEPQIGAALGVVERTLEGAYYDGYYDFEAQDS